MDAQWAGKALLVIGLLVCAIGAVLYFGGGRWFSFLGRLPGDIRIEGEHSKIFIPLGTSILLSIVLTLLLALISKLR